jgi:hypothetical protein
VGHRSTTALLDRKARLGSIQRLNLALFVHAQDDGVLGGIQVKGHDIHQLLFKLGIVTDLETNDPMGFEPCLLAPRSSGGG